MAREASISVHVNPEILELSGVNMWAGGCCFRQPCYFLQGRWVLDISANSERKPWGMGGV